MALVLSEIAPSQRREIAGGLLDDGGCGECGGRGTIRRDARRADVRCRLGAAAAGEYGRALAAAACDR